MKVFVSSTQRIEALESWRRLRFKPAKSARRPQKVLVWFVLVAILVGPSKPVTVINFGSAPYGRSALLCPVRYCG